MVQSSRVHFAPGVLLLLSALLMNHSIPYAYASRDIFLRSNNEESFISKKEPSHDEELNKISIAHIKTDGCKERERDTFSNDIVSTSQPMHDMKDNAGKQEQVSGENNSPRKYFRETKEDTRTSSDFKPSFDLPGNNRIDGQIPFFDSDYGHPSSHTPRHN